ncbi:MFS transporter [Amycolatopsis sp. NPDC049253]|uniref:MFS transporter n=1 Tax=Amycolatopsis sp. NPDC049253 TaxID=3155274 RepID=UPI00343ED6A6
MPGAEPEPAGGTAPHTTSATAEIPLRRNRQFRILWIGQALSGFGSAMSFLVVPLLLLAAGYSPSVAGTLGTVTLLIGLAVRMPGGFLADRFDQRRVMVVCDLLQLAAVGAAAVCVFFVPLPVAVALGLVVLTQAAQEVYGPAHAKLLRRIVPSGQLADAVSVNQARGYGASLIAPSVGGVLLAVDPALPFAVDALTFGASALCLVLLATSRTRRTGEVRPEKPAEPLLKQVGAGWRHLVRDPFLRTSSVYFAVLNLLFSTFTYALILGIGREPGGTVIAGAALSSSAVAGLAGSLIAPFAQRKLPLPVVLAAGPALAAGLLALTWAGAGVIPFAGAFSALCLLTPVIGATLATVMAKVVPDEIYGRVNAANSFVAQILQPCGPILSGVLLGTLSLATTASALLVVFAVLAVLAFFLPVPRPSVESD